VWETSLKVFFVLCHQASQLHGEIREALIAEQLRDSGHDARVFRIYGGSTLKIDSFRDKVPVYFFPSDNHQSDVHVHVSKSLREFLIDNRPDVILFKGIDYDLVPYVLDGLENIAPKIGFIIGGVTIHPMLRRGNFAFIESSRQESEIANFLETSFPTLKLAKFVDWKAADEFYQTEKEYDIVNVGYFEDRKNQIGLRPFFGKHKLAIVGYGPTLTSVQASASGFAEVNFLGDLNNRDVIRTVCKSRLMVHTSLWEGLPRVIVESLSCGVPVVAFRSAIQEDFSDTDSVLLIEPDELVSTVEGLLLQPERLRELSANARSYALRTHGAQRFAEAAKAIVAFSRVEEAA